MSNKPCERTRPWLSGPTALVDASDEDFDVALGRMAAKRLEEAHSALPAENDQDFEAAVGSGMSEGVEGRLPLADA
ncbi:gamma-glutamyl phosphate reductase [Streptomyces sp. LBL]|uniref:hypothetical protein n=1 Tax=Streptomyces sp. LBL TaxID=2940562 RepID=UPI0024771CE7|nr:hypothetical protein [Streptomyces sp. LBL]MDH6622607.1 gamma-glutamyl phosphate reductase [Streptomyces sp. LBL]